MFNHPEFTLRKNVNQITDCYTANMEHARKTQTMQSFNEKRPRGRTMGIYVRR
jgi:hypothetical protein